MTMPETDPFAAEGNGSSVRDQVRGIKDQAIERGRTTLRDARDRAATSLGEGKNQVADQIGAVAHAFRQAGNQLRTEGQGQRLAGLTSAMARQADQAADYLRRADGELLRQDVERLARRQPALVLGGAFVAGLIGARFLKSSERRRTEQYHGEGWDESGYGSRAIADESAGVYRTPGSTIPASYSPGRDAPIGGADAGS
jgi:hypothetical protein